MASVVVFAVVALLCLGVPGTTSAVHGTTTQTPTTKSPDQLLLQLQAEMTSLRKENLQMRGQLNKLSAKIDKLTDGRCELYCKCEIGT